MTDPYQRVFRILREAVDTKDNTKHRAMTIRALIELADTMATGRNTADRKGTP